MIKKITLLMLFVSFTAFAQFPEDFSTLTGTTFPTGWTTFVGANGLGTVENWKSATDASGVDLGYAFCKWEEVTAGQVAEDWLVTPQFTVDATNYMLSFDNLVFNTTDYGSVLTVRVSTGSQTTHADYTIVDTQTETDIRNGATSLVFTNHRVNLSTYVGQAVYVAFVWAQNDGDAVAIDNVNMLQENTVVPGIAVNPNPADGATGVMVNGGDANNDGTADNSVTLTWDPPTTGDPAISYKLYIGTDAANLSLGGTFTGRNITWSGRALSTTYYWQVIPTNDIGDAANAPVWSFTTAATADVQNINEVEELFTVFPNPTQERLNISSALTVDTVAVFNELGQVVLSEKATNSINVATLKKGIYFVNIQSADKSQTIKFIKE